MNNNHQQIAVLDFGSQYTHLIARRFRQLGVLAKIYPADYDFREIADLIGVVLSGGPSSVSGYNFNSEIFDLNLPILGLCFGHQLIAKQLGGQVKQSRDREYGQADLNVSGGKLLAGLTKQETVWMSHGDSVVKPPPNFQVLGTTTDKSIAAMGDENKNIYGLQFHPEVTHTVNGLKILKNFAFPICGAKGDWDSSNLLAEVLKQIVSQAQDKKVFLLVSGGVDSTVALALLEKALGKDRVYGLYIDTGLMRYHETQEISRSLPQAGFTDLHIYDGQELFLKDIKGVIDPEEKRKIIGQTFLDIKDKVVKELKLDDKEWMLGQGTIYPDTIETGGTKAADTIKTHHNRVEAIQRLIDQGMVIEPIKEFYKDEVRQLGQVLNLPDSIVNRHPFPGPGLAIRCLASDGKSDVSDAGLVEINDDVNRIVEGEKLVVGSYVLPVKSVGVQGDNRTYAHPAVLKVTSLDWERLGKLSNKITNSLDAINRVLVEFNNDSSKNNQAQSAKLLAATVTKDRLDRLRQLDVIVLTEVKQAGLYDKIWQFPVVLLPFGSDYKESLVLRPVQSLEAMTARFYPLPQTVLEKITERVNELGIISHIYIDITNKPPGTIEWE